MRRGYTLTELAFALGMLVIVGLILAPGARDARDRAQRTGCGSNVKELSFALLQYQEDWDEHAPAAEFGHGAGSYSWRLALYPYTKHSQCFFCPADDEEADSWRAEPIGPNRWGPYREVPGHTSYGASRVHADPGPPYPAFEPSLSLAPNIDQSTPLTTPRVQRPAELIAFVELGGLRPILTFESNEHGSFQPRTRVAARHRGYVTVGFVDCHVMGYNTPSSPCLQCTDKRCWWSDAGRPTPREPSP